MTIKRYPGDELVVKGGDKRGVILLSGGIDSVVVLELAVRHGWELAALSIDYGQQHYSELEAAQMIAKKYNIEQVTFTFDAGVLIPSALTSMAASKPDPDDPDRSEFYVPGRNTIFLSLALGMAEARGLNSIFIGATLEDNIAFTDCRPPFLAQFEKVARLATGKKFAVRAPLLQMRKLDVIRCGVELGAPLSLTRSCYFLDGEIACGKCPSCAIRMQAFADLKKEMADVVDPATYFE